MKSIFLLFAAVFAVTADTAAAQVDWVHAGYGTVPQGALVAGREASGAPLYVCGASYAGGYHLGKVRPGFSGCNIGYGGREVTMREYDVAVGSAYWVAASGGSVPANAFGPGGESNGASLFVCRAQYAGGLHPGKVRPGFSGCNIGYGGNEITVYEYEVMVW